MKSIRNYTVLIIAASILTINAFAAKDNHKGQFSVSTPVQVNGKQLPAGDYVAQWDGAGPSVQVNIMQDGKVVATVSARLVTLDQKAGAGSAEIRNYTKGNGALSEIRFSGKAYALQFGEETAEKSAPAGDKPASQ